MGDIVGFDLNRIGLGSNLDHPNQLAKLFGLAAVLVALLDHRLTDLSWAADAALTVDLLKDILGSRGVGIPDIQGFKVEAGVELVGNELHDEVVVL